MPETQLALSTRSPLASHWTLDPDVAYLNHGSFGACPAAILAHQTELRARLERQPMDFLLRDLPAALAEARVTLAAVLGADPEDLVFVTNATAGVNAVIASLAFAPGDELLTTNHVYGACRRTLEHAAFRSGARVVVVPVPFPVASEDEIVDAILAGVTERTRIALLDHVTSPTALVFPIERLVRELAARGVDTLVDAAHAPGMVPLALSSLGAAYATGNMHKWLCTPKGAAFLHVRKDRQTGIHPTVISHYYAPPGAPSRFREEFDWTGTQDPTAWLSVPASIAYLAGLVPGGLEEVMQRNHALALRARTILCEAFDVPSPCPESLIGSIASVPLPKPRPGTPADGLDHDGVTAWCRARGVQTWVTQWPARPEPGRLLVRASAQLYNDEGQYVRLAALLREAFLGA